jgi:hypothetical protein
LPASQKAMVMNETIRLVRFEGVIALQLEVINFVWIFLRGFGGSCVRRSMVFASAIFH